MTNSDQAAPGFGIYIHWPFCQSKCPYCDFNSHVSDAVDHAEWCQALLAEISYFASETNNRTVTSIFMGGGTPSLMEPATVEALITAIHNHWPVAPGVEITLEANPSTAEIKRFQAFRGAGINRLSLGVQSLIPEQLTALGRKHSASEARSAIDMAAQVFPRYSFDLIYARPGQKPEEWQQELTEALTLAGDHLSLYQLTVEPGTEFYRREVPMAEEGLAAELYEMTGALLTDAGLPAYEISNHARPGQESRHNLVYWRGEDYLGIGPGAHGRITTFSETNIPLTEAIHQISTPARWLQAVSNKGHGTAKRRQLVSQDRAEEVLMTGLRLREGINKTRFKSVTGFDLDSFVSQNASNQLIGGGFLEINNTTFRATEEGRQRLNGMLKLLLT